MIRAYRPIQQEVIANHEITFSGMPGSMMTFGYFLSKEKNISSIQYMMISVVDSIITFLFLFNGQLLNLVQLTHLISAEPSANIDRVVY